MPATAAKNEANGSDLVSRSTDPTKLTQDAVDRTQEWADKVLKIELCSIRQELDRVLDAIKLVPRDIELRVNPLEKLTTEKFVAVYEQQRKAEANTKTNIDTALQAAKELVNQQNTANALAADKSDRQTADKISQQGAMFQTRVDGLEGKQDQLKDNTNDKVSGLDRRVSVLEGLRTGQAAQQTTQQATTGNMNAMIGWIIGAAGVIGMIIVALIKH